MIPKIKKFYKNNKKLVIIILLVLIVLIAFLFIYKLLFYSNKETEIYGVRLRDIKENEFTQDDIKILNQKASDIEGIRSIKINVKGRLIKIFVTFDEGLSHDDMKGKFNEVLANINEKVKSYYDITFYAIKEANEENKYPVIGYKHKNSSEISFEVF